MAFVDISPPIYVSIPKNNGITVEMPRHPGAVVPIPSGAQGLPGEPGFSPVVSVEEITGGNRVTITDAEGETSFDVMNGAQGAQGEPGEGVPAGGAQGQVLKKRSNADYDTEWGSLTASDVGALPSTTVIPLKVSDLTNDSGFVNATQAAAAAPIQSVNGQKGNVQTITLLDVYPVGSIYMSVNATSPATLFGGTWERIKDTFLLSAGDTYSAGDTGGEATHTLTVNEMPTHYHEGLYWGDFSVPLALNSGGLPLRLSHTGSGADNGFWTGKTGGGQAHNNMPPYLAVYVWKRTA